MSLNSETSRIQHCGNNSTSEPYLVPFVFYEAGDLKVVLTNAAGVDTVLTQGIGYSVSGGNVRTTVAYNNTYKITIYREVLATQTTVYDENSDFPAKSHERALDKLTMLVQQVGRTVKQAFRFRESDGTGEAPPAALVKNSLFGLTNDGKPLFRTPDEVANFLNLDQRYFDQPTASFADEVERVAVVPKFAGQLGTQRDDGTIWIGTATVAGAWTRYQPFYTQPESNTKFARFRPDITLLTGGDDDTLDGIVTATGEFSTTGLPLFIVINGALSAYLLTPGTTAESSPTIIRPDDFNSTTNAKIWKLVL